jgi:hypothetical protein
VRIRDPVSNLCAANATHHLRVLHSLRFVAGGDAQRFLPACRVGDVDLGEMSVLGPQRGHLGAEPHVDQRIRFDPGNEVGRHALGEPVAAHDHRHLRPGFGKVQRSLPCGVTRPDTATHSPEH